MDTSHCFVPSFLKGVKLHIKSNNERRERRINLNSLRARRYIRLGHCLCIDAGLDCTACRVPGVPAFIVPLNLYHPPPCCFFGHPLFLFPLGVHPSATAQSSVESFFRTWPIQFNLLRLTSPLTFSASFISFNVSFRICCCYLISRIFLRHLVWKVFILFFSVLVSFHVSYLNHC